MPTKPQLPKRLKVGAAFYKISLHPVGSERWLALQEDGFIGMCRPNQRQIDICGGTSPDCEAEISLHEALHAIFADSGVFRGPDGVPSDYEETVVDSLSQRLAAFCADNPDYIKYLLSAFGRTKG